MELKEILEQLEEFIKDNESSEFDKLVVEALAAMGQRVADAEEAASGVHARIDALAEAEEEHRGKRK